MLFGIRELLFATVVFAVGCTQISSGDDLAVWEETDTKDDCARCSGSFECASDNCREVLCGESTKPTVCLPEGVDESTPSTAIGCDWNVICP